MYPHAEIESKWKLIFIDSRFQLAKSNSEKKAIFIFGEKYEDTVLKNREKINRNFKSETVAKWRNQIGDQVIHGRGRPTE